MASPEAQQSFRRDRRIASPDPADGEYNRKHDVLIPVYKRVVKILKKPETSRSQLPYFILTQPYKVIYITGTYPETSLRREAEKRAAGYMA